MVKIAKLLWRIADGIALSLLGLTVIDLFTIVSLEKFEVLDFLTEVDTLTKTIMAILGVLYFALKGWDDHKMKKLEREHKRIENLIKREELEAKEFDNDEKKTPIYA